jgi:3-hydroxyisobutyrate dehydrogenase-like beta-hydroxyacid dehydrogenase
MNRINTNTPVGFVGVDAMGSRIVRRLLANGYKVTVYNRNRTEAEILIADGAAVSDSLSALATRTKLIIGKIRPRSVKLCEPTTIAGLEQT